MPVLSIILYPDPVLRSRADEVADVSAPSVRELVASLWDTLDSHDGVGIAANQVGGLLRVIAVDATRARRPVKNHGRLTLINPVMVAREGTIAFREGCLSIPHYVARVPRAQSVVVWAVDASGSPLTVAAEGFEAVILQHEIDHLDGVLFIDRVRSARDLKPRRA